MAGFGQAIIVAFKNLAQGRDLLLAIGDQIILAGDEIEFADFYFALFGVMRIVQDNEQVIFELVQVRVMDGRDNGAGGEWMDLEFIFQILDILIFGSDDVNPGVVLVGDDFSHWISSYRQFYPNPHHLEKQLRKSLKARL